MIATKDDLDRKVEGQTIASRWLETMAAHPDNVALRAKDGDRWVEWTYADVGDRVARAAAGLRTLGVGPGDRVVLMMRNVPEFHVVDLATMFCGATAVSIYNSSPPEQVAYLTGHSGATVAIVEDLGFAERFTAVRDDLPQLEHLVVLAGAGGADDPAGHGALIAGGALLEGHDPIDLHASLSDIDPDTLATVIYTSGTTGPPKGVMISHYNVVWTVEGYLDLLGIDPVGFRAISYLPMAHIAERMSSHYLAGIAGFEVTTCPDPSLIGQYLREVHPETMFGVPRVWEKIHAGIQAALSANDDAKARFDQAVAAADPIAERRTLGTATDEDERTWASLDELAFRNVRQLVGLDCLQYAITGAAPIPPELIRWYRAIGVPMSEIYGLSETTGPMTWDPEEVRVGTVGRAFPGVDVFLGDDGEVCCRGGNVFVGYLNDADKTADALEPDGTFHSGDIGEIDDDGYVRIVDRKKELIITAGGKNVSPANLEVSPQDGGAHRPGVRDRRRAAVRLGAGGARPRGCAGMVPRTGHRGRVTGGAGRRSAAADELQRAVDQVMLRFSTAERVRRIAVLGDEWLPDGDELTPTSKLKRRGILAKYSDQIESLYA